MRLSPASVLKLQRTIGNRATARLLARAPGDRAPDPMPDSQSANLEAKGSFAGGLIQLKRALVTADAHSRVVTGGLGTEPRKNIKKIASSPKGTRYAKYAEVSVMDSDWFHQKDPSGAIVWYQLNNTPQKEYIRAKKVLTGFSTAGQFDAAKGPKPESGGELGAGLQAGANLFNAADDPALEWSRKETLALQSWQERHPGVDPTSYTGTTDPPPPGATTELTRAEGALWMGGGLLGMAASLRDLTDDDKSAWERVNAAINFMSAGAATGGAIAQVASTHIGSEESAGLASETSAWLLGYQEMFTTLAAGVKTIKSVVDLVKMLADDSKHDSKEWVATSGDLLINGLETAKGVLRSVRQINETLGGAVTTQFAQVLPVLDIAIAAVKSIMQGFYLVVSAVNWHSMAARAQALVGEADFGEESMNEARKAYGKDEASISNLGALIAEKQTKIAAVEQQLRRPKSDKAKQVLLEKKQRLERKKLAYEATRRSKLIDASITEERFERAGGPSRAEVEEYDLARSLETANKRRVTRQAVHIGTNLVQIAGSIASLVSGPGAPAAIALKAAAAGIDMSLPFLRWVKQYGRGAAARQQAKGEEGLASKIFNADKSDAAKLADRKKQAVVMLKMIARLNVYLNDPAKRPQIAMHAQRIESYLHASGVDTDALYALNGKPEAQIALLVKAIAQRELSE